MDKKNLVKKIFVLCVIFVLVLVYIPSASAGVIRRGFIVGPIESKTQDGDKLSIIASFAKSPGTSLNIISPFRSTHLHQGQQILLAQFNKCFFIKNLVIGFCKIYFPSSEISMHIVKHVEVENEVVWEVDEIKGDGVWENNIEVSLYNESGGKYHGGFIYGPLTKAYLSIGDQISIETETDGYFYFKFTESISKDVLFQSPLVKY